MEDVLNLENIYPYQRRIPERTKLRPEGKARSPYLRVWMTAPSPTPPPPATYLKVWNHHCLPCSYCVHFRPWYRALLFLLTHSSWKIRQNTQSCVQRLFNSLGESAAELQSSLLTEFSKLLSTQKVSKAWIFLHFSFPDNGIYGLSTWIFWTFWLFKGLQRLPNICSTELELMLK